MDYNWHLSKFDRVGRTVSLTSETGYDYNDFFCDIDTLNSMALQHKASSGNVEVGDDDGPVIITFTFSIESNWEDFCNEFLTPEVEDTPEESE